MEGLSDKRDGRSSFAAFPVCVGDGAGWGMDWMRDEGANETTPYIVSIESSGVAFG